MKGPLGSSNFRRLLLLLATTIITPFCSLLVVTIPAEVVPVNVAYETGYLHDVPVDHFGMGTTDTFTLKYLYNSENYRQGGPIFFYTGNEGAIKLFGNQTGIMYELAPMFHAFLLFGEHRYYGESLPYGRVDSFRDMQHLQYLNSRQALADYTMLIAHVKEKFGLPHGEDGGHIPVIAFGGSYGGLLAAWFRMKYPAVVLGAWASAAPIRIFREGNRFSAPLGGWSAVIKHTMLEAGCSEQTIHHGFEAIFRLAQNEKGRGVLNKVFKLDKRSQVTSPQEAVILYAYVRNGLQFLALSNYPYPTSFMAPVPGWPAAVACQYLTQDDEKATSLSDKAVVSRLQQAVNVYYNYSGQLSSTACINMYTCGKDFPLDTNVNFGLAWFFQFCTEIALASCDEGEPNDLFIVPACNATTFEQNRKSFCTMLISGVHKVDGFSPTMVNVDAVGQWYGTSLEGASNIIFSHGSHDPCSAGRPTFSSSGDGPRRGLFSYLIAGGAHHLELRQPNKCDPASVREMRRRAVEILRCWLVGARAAAADSGKGHSMIANNNNDHAASAENEEECSEDFYRGLQEEPLPEFNLTTHLFITTAADGVSVAGEEKKLKLATSAPCCPYTYGDYPWQDGHREEATNGAARV